MAGSVQSSNGRRATGKMYGPSYKSLHTKTEGTIILKLKPDLIKYNYKFSIPNRTTDIWNKLLAALFGDTHLSFSNR